jgi:hypothetical protein
MTSGTERAKDALPALTALHDELDRETRGLAVVHADCLQCHWFCHACCVDDLSVARGPESRSGLRLP